MSNQQWTKAEEQYVRDNAGVVSDEVGAAQLSAIVKRKISQQAWRKKRQELGIVKAPGRGICRVLSR